ncbi:MAG: hypothetical protein ACLFWL_12090 [Candidatus Brocadiia bacterium]
MAEEEVTVFRPYDFEIGQKIQIDGGPRNGDWEVIDCDEKTVTLRCPLSGREFGWKRFCYAVTTERSEWPQGEE